jgi:hypothetical protein
VAEIYRTATEYVANEITLTRGSVSDITSVGVYYTADPSVIPEIADFTTVILVDGTDTPLPALAETGKIDVLTLVGPAAGDVLLTAGDYQTFVLIQSATENIIRKVDVLTIL